MTHLKNILFCITIFVACVTMSAQNSKPAIVQTIKGRAIDKVTGQGLPGASVKVEFTGGETGVMADEEGYFKVPGIPVGRANLSISYLGYNQASYSGLSVISGKELVINAEMEEKVTVTEEVVVTAAKSKTKVNNEMAAISSRMFTVEETERYAGSRGDVARMASNFAGVSFADDSRNDIVIRGNSPSGLLWKLEDVEIPNPNHFAENGTTGGPVGMLNNNVLKNSDFMTGAFAAEYGNALSGVFDLKMRNGNADNYEFLGQVGFNGFEAGAEGPISKKNKSSFLFNYRYSTLDLMYKMGFNFGTSGVPKYQDLSFKANYPIKNGVITCFGIAGESSIDMKSPDKESKDPDNDMYSSEGQNLFNYSSMAATGLSLTLFPNSKKVLKISLSGLTQDGGTNIDTLRKNPQIETITLPDGKTLNDTINYFDKENPIQTLEHYIAEYRTTATITLANKYSAKLNTKLGISADQMGYSLDSKVFLKKNVPQPGLYQAMDASKSLFEGPQLYKAFYEASLKITDNITFNPGLYATLFSLNNSKAFEPRAATIFEYSNGKKINIGYGLHSKTHPLSVYYLVEPDAPSRLETNKNLDFTKAHHFILGHDWNINKDFRLKTEAYYQYLFNIPVETRSSSFSLLNSGATWGVDAEDSLVNKGKGYNYGFELTFEKFLSRNYYFLLTTSLFDSKYKASDNKWRNTAFNGNYVVNALVGYEYPVNQKWTLCFDVKTSFAGGKRYTEVDMAKSLQERESKYKEDQTYEKQYPMFFKMDVKFTIKNNNLRYSQEWQIFVENVTNHQNLLYEYFDSNTLRLKKVNQLGFFPMMMWRLNF